MGNFDRIETHILNIICSLCYKKLINVIFMVFIFSRISNKRKLRENMFSVKISTFTVLEIITLRPTWLTLPWI